MIYGYFTLCVALVISAIAEYYSIIGLTAIFSAAFWPVVIMGAALGVGKLTAAVWLKLNWERASWAYRLYLVPAVAFLMLLTSIGCFGYLSKAHSDQSLVSGDSMAKVAIYDEKIKISKDNIDANRKALKQMDEAVDQVMGRSADEKGADKAVAIRRGQQKERARLQSEIQAEQKTITALGEEAAPLRAEFRKVESEVGPIKYIAALVYGDNPDSGILEKAVRLVIMIIVAVFDPLALVLILAAQQSIKWSKEEKEQISEPVIVAVPPVESIDEKDAAVTATVDDVEPTAQSVPTEPQTTDPTNVDLFAYLKQPFVHFSNLTPMVHKPEPSTHSIMEDTAAMAFVTPEKVEEIKQELDAGFVYQPDVPKPITDFPELQAAIKQGLEDGSIVIQGATEEPKILAMGIDDVERPGDYITPPEPEWTGPMREVIEEHIDPNTRIKTFNHTWVPDLSAHADNEISGKAVNAGFGTKFPESAEKSDMYLRVDYLPARLFKFNGVKWIEVDKNATDSYTYNDEYIKYLIDKINSGEYDVETLSDSEQEQIKEYLARNDN